MSVLICPQCELSARGAFGKPSLVSVLPSRLESFLGILKTKCEKCGSLYQINTKEQPK